ncbi:hypothetical protein QBC38DRAFT_16823 [Podospora fimiseda]|uniref:Uncharacterized protein n=1 Tax=Podospora fimiseda TaxID=252190 RepID=A0AAN7BJJ8_9PEZI|nr:hypothetical protein QBC38DRAFT_16823 [Podospora fimiseda]
MMDCVYCFRSWENCSKKKSEPETGPILPPIPFLLAAAPEESWSPIDAQTTSYFFKLPPELRREILFLAFGNRTIHIDLRFVMDPTFPNPTFPNPNNLQNTKRHGRFPGLSYRADGGSKYKGTPIWKWYSCICHNTLPPGYNQYNDDYIPITHLDSCLSSQSNCCDFPGEQPEKCHLGAMGSLLACKRLYGGDYRSHLRYKVFLEPKNMIAALVK